LTEKESQIKNAESLARSDKEIEEINRKMKTQWVKKTDPKYIWETVELRNMVDLPKIMVSAAKYRTESRGCTFSGRFPNHRFEMELCGYLPA